MKIILIAAVLLMSEQAQAFSAPANDYVCKVDPRGVMVCYPKPRGF